MLTYLLEKQPLSDPTKPVNIKFAFDGGTITSCKRIQQEQDTMQILTDHSLEKIKSHKHTHQWILYLEEEDYDTMQQELTNTLPDIISLIENGKVNIV